MFTKPVWSVKKHFIGEPSTKLFTKNYTSWQRSKNGNIHSVRTVFSSIQIGASYNQPAHVGTNPLASVELCNHHQDQNTVLTFSQRAKHILTSSPLSLKLVFTASVSLLRAERSSLKMCRVGLAKCHDLFISKTVSLYLQLSTSWYYQG